MSQRFTTTMATKTNIVVVGAGMTGIMAAFLLRRKYPDRDITIVESGASLGGNYRCIDYGAHGKFDQGMRMLYETGIPEFDSLLHSLLPEDQWLVFSGNQKDIAGIFWNGRLQTYSPYIDLRCLPSEQFECCKKELLQLIREPMAIDMRNAATYLRSIFGQNIAEHLGAVLQKLYALPPELLAPMATHQPAINRVILFDLEFMRDNPAGETMRSRIAWPDQLTLPPGMRQFDQCALYPKAYGMDTVLNAQYQRFEQENIKVSLGDAIERLEISNGRVERLVTRKKTTISSIENIYWTGNLTALAKLIDPSIPLPPAPISPALMVHFFLKIPPQGMERLYHFYCFEKGFHTFRITHYANYCPQAMVNGMYPICIEMWHLEGDDSYITQTAISELQRLNLIDDAKQALLIGISRTQNLHAMCSLESLNRMNDVRDKIDQESLANLTVLGVFSPKNKMLLYEVWRDMYHTINQSGF